MINLFQKASQKKETVKTQAKEEKLPPVIEKNLPKYENLATHIKKGIQEDIIATAVQNQRDLLKIPKELKSDYGNTSFNLDFVTKQIEHKGNEKIIIKELKLGFQCQLFHPFTRSFVDCTLQIDRKNCKFLSCKFTGKSQDDKIKDEMYNIAKIIQYDGFLSTEEAQDYLQQKYGCKKASIKKNVLRLKTYKFERIFLFLEQEAKESSQKPNIEGQEKLMRFSKAISILVQALAAIDEDLKGQIAEVKEIKQPERPMINIAEMYKDAGMKTQGIQHLASSVRNQPKTEEDIKKEENTKNCQQIISQNLNLLDHFLVNVVNEEELADLEKEEAKQEEKERQEANGGFSKLKLELRFSNQLSSIPFIFVVEGQRDDFWTGVSKNFSKINVKATDYNLLKVYLSDINQQQIFFDDQQAIGFFFADFYEFFLKKNAKENFIQWFDKSYKYLSGDNPLLLKKHKLPRKQEDQLKEQYKKQAADLIRKKDKKPPFNLMEFTQLKLMQVSEKYEDFKAKQAEIEDDPDMKEFINEKLKECVFQAAVFHQKNNMNQYKKLVFKRIKKQQTADLKQQKEKTKEESIRKLDRFIKDKEVKLLAKDSNSGINPLVEILNLLTLQEIDIRLRRLNEIPLMRQRGKWKRGGKKEGARKRRGVYLMAPKLDRNGMPLPLEKQKKPYKKRLRQKKEFEEVVYKSRLELQAMTSKDRNDAVSRGQLVFEQKLKMALLKKKSAQNAHQKLLNKQKTKLAKQQTNWIKPIEKKNIAALTAKGLGKKLLGNQLTKAETKTNTNNPNPIQNAFLQKLTAKR